MASPSDPRVPVVQLDIAVFHSEMEWRVAGTYVIPGYDRQEFSAKSPFFGELVHIIQDLVRMGVRELQEGPPDVQ